MDITLGELIEKPKIVIFGEGQADEFYLHCKEREAGIKNEIGIAHRTFRYHIIKIKEVRDTLQDWEKEKMKSCCTNLGEYMSFLIKELDKEKIENYCSLFNAKGERLIPFLPDMILLLINSYQGAVETDLHWVGDLNLSDTIDLSIGDFDYTELEKYIPKRIESIQLLCEDLKDILDVKAHTEAIIEAITCYHTKHIKACNVLLLTVVEGLVRSLATKLVEVQKLTVNLSDKQKFSSVNNLLNKISWRKDFKVSNIKQGLLSGNLKQYITKQPEFVKITLAERLGFLSRRFKENRNVILHGEQTGYANPLNSFMNFTALREVLLTIKEYCAIYPEL